MEHLKLAWTYRFWIVLCVVVLMPIVSYFIDTKSLAKNAESRAGTLKSTVTALEAAAKGPNPNDKWVEAVSGLKESLSAQVDVAWVDLYTKQAAIMTWPESVKKAYLAAGETGDVDTNVKISYQSLYPAQFSDLYRLVDPVDAKGKGKVELNSKILEKYIQPWASERVNPPTVPQAWQAQEDIWLLRALLGVIARANSDSTKVQDSMIKTVQDIRIGVSAVDATLRTKAPKEQLAPRGAGTTKEEAREIKGAIFRQIPVYMELIVDQRRLLPVLAQFGNSEIPMQVKQVEVSELPMAARQAARLATLAGDVKGAQPPQGVAPAKEDEFFHMTELRVWARAIMYNKPPKIELAEKEAAKATASSSTAPASGAPN